MTQATPNNYWISSTALHIERNALGLPDYIQASCVSGAVIMCHMKGIPGLDLDAGHNPRRWSLQASPTVFNTHTEKYIYVAIPRHNDNNPAIVVFPSEVIDIYGCTHSHDGYEDDVVKQIGSEDYYYIYLQASLTSSGDNGTINREWRNGKEPVTGLLDTYEQRINPTDSEWYQYSTVSQIVTFLKNLTMKAGTLFINLFAHKLAIKSYGEEKGSITFENGGGEVEKVAEFSTLSDNSAKQIVTPKYIKDRETEVENKYLRKDQADKTEFGLEMASLKVNGNADVQGTHTSAQATIKGDLTMGDSTLPFERGISGAAIYRDETGYHIQTDFLTVTKKMFATEVEIQQVSHIGGQIMLTAANCTVQRIVPFPTGYRLLFYAKDNDGVSIHNDWKVGDQAYCKTFNLTEGTTENFANQYYWRLVTGKGSQTLDDIDYHYIDVSKLATVVIGGIAYKGCDSASQEPQVGDKVVLLGSQMDTSRQGATILGGAGDMFGLYIFKGINDFTLANKLVDEISPSQVRIVANELRIVVGNDTKSVDEYVSTIVPDDIKKELAKSEKMVIKGKLESVTKGTIFTLQSGDMYVGTYTLQGDGTYTPTITNTSGLLTSRGLAQILAEGENDVKAAITVYVNDKNSGITLTADRIAISSGTPSHTLGTYWSIDEHGNAILNDILAHNITVEGVINNLVNTIDVANNINADKIIYENEDYLDILNLGDIINIQSDNGRSLYLPYYISDAFNKRTYTKYGTGESHAITAQELKQLIGRKVTIFFGNGTHGQYLYYGYSLLSRSADTLYGMLNGTPTANLPSGGPMGIPMSAGGMVHLEFKVFQFYDTNTRTWTYGYAWVASPMQAGINNLDTAWT